MRLPPVLLYHAISALPESADGEERRLFVDPTSFEEQMRDLVARGFTTLSLDRFAAVVAGSPAPPRSLLVTFDDAYAHVDDVVTPVLAGCGFSAVMFACPSQLGGSNTWDSTHRNLSRLKVATAERLREMAKGPWEIASHGKWHVDQRHLDPEQRLRELREARLELSECVAKPVRDLAYPFGRDDAATRQAAAAAGYRMAFTASYMPAEDRMHLPRRPIAGTDSMTTFRLKTNSWSEAVYRVRGVVKSVLGASQA